MIIIITNDIYKKKNEAIRSRRHTRIEKIINLKSENHPLPPWRSGVAPYR